MADTREHPLRRLQLHGRASTAARSLGGFSDVSGIGTEITVAEYRNGNEKENHVRKSPGVHKVGDVTLQARHHRLEDRCSTGSRRPAPPASTRKKTT